MTCAEFIEIWKHYDKDKSGYLEEKEIGHFLLDLLRVNRVGGAKKSSTEIDRRIEQPSTTALHRYLLNLHRGLFIHFKYILYE